MSALIPELIDMARDPAVPTSALLSHSLIAAHRLQLVESVPWLQHELDGYPTLDALPDYRRPRGVLYAIYPSGTTTPLHVARTASAEVVQIAELLSVCPLIHPLRELETWVASGESVRVRRQLEDVIVFQQEFKKDFEPATVLTHGQLVGCLDAIRSRVLRWALELETAGIKGESLTFCALGQQKAQQLSELTIVIEGNAQGFQFMQHSPGGQQQQTVTSEQKVEALEALLPLLVQVIAEGKLQQTALADLRAIHAALQALASSPAPSWSVIGVLAGSVRSILEGAGGGVLAAQALDWLTTLTAG